MSHEKDIHCDSAIIFWAEPCKPVIDWPPHIKADKSGWVLPGGQRTKSRDIAEMVARNMTFYLTP